MTPAMLATFIAVVIAATGTLLSVVIFVAKSVITNINSVSNALRIEIHGLRDDIKELKNTLTRLEERQWEQAKDIERLKASQE
jgi:predicted PurR-regulated permease PerM